MSEDERWLIAAGTDDPEAVWAPVREVAAALAADLYDDERPAKRRTLVRQIAAPNETAPVTQDVPAAYVDARFPEAREPTAVEHARALFALGRLDTARRKLEDALAANPSSGAAHFQLGLVLRRLDFPAMALTHLEAAADTAPDEPVVLEKLGRVLLELERASEVEEVFANLLRLDDTPARRRDLAEALAMMEASKSAEPLVAEALAADIDDPLALALLAEIRARQGVPDAARALLSEAQRLLRRRSALRGRVEPVLGRVRGVLS